MSLGRVLGMAGTGRGEPLSWDPALTPIHCAAFQTQPDLWAEVESLLEPWANVTLTCHACLETMDFELFKDGVTQKLVHLGLPAMEHQFPLGPVTSDTQGLYRCRSGLSSGWTQLSNLLEVTGAGERRLLRGHEAMGRSLLERPHPSTPHSPGPTFLAGGEGWQVI